jgi:hypothetical protein
MLMMGGDDIMLLCVPEFVHHFLKHFDLELKKANPGEDTELKKANPGEEKASYSLGIAFFKHNYPFSHANELAESLLDSAKIKSRGTKTICNAVDWHVLYSTKPQSIAAIRQQDYLIGYEDGHVDVLSGKPYTLDEALEVFEQAADLAKYLSQKSKDDKDEAGRNKFKMLRTSIYKGRKYTENLIGELFPEKAPSWLKFDERGMTRMLDIVELLDTIPEEEK